MEELRASIANSVEEVAAAGDRQFVCCNVRVEHIQRTDTVQVRRAGTRAHTHRHTHIPCIAMLG